MALWLDERKLKLKSTKFEQFLKVGLNDNYVMPYPFYRSQNILGWSKCFVPDQKFIHILS